MTRPTRVHLIEPGGQGGVFQHTVELARLLGISGVDTIVHTARDRELLDVGGVVFCGCVTALDAEVTRFRKPRDAFRYLFVSLPHWLRSTRGDVAHVQGLYRIPLYAITLGLLRLSAREVVFSPHNTFARSDRWLDARTLTLAVRRLANRVVVYSVADEEHLLTWGVQAVRCPLVQVAVNTDPNRVDEWRARLGGDAGRPIVLLPGYIRADKGIDVVIKAMPLLRHQVQLAVVGEDLGALPALQTLARDTGVGVVWEVGYHSVDDFTSAVTAADAVVVAYRRASQSGVLSLASRVGTPSVATPVGGLAEFATVVAAGMDEHDLASAIDTLLGGEFSGTPVDQASDVTAIYLGLLRADAH